MPNSLITFCILYITFALISPKSSHLSSMHGKASLTKTPYYIFMLDQLFSQNRSPYSCTVTKEYCLTQRHCASGCEHEFLCAQQILLPDSFCSLIFLPMFVEIRLIPNVYTRLEMRGQSLHDPKLLRM